MKLFMHLKSFVGLCEVPGIRCRVGGAGVRVTRSELAWEEGIEAGKMVKLPRDSV